jgi:heat shock protein HtpX
MIYEEISSNKWKSNLLLLAFIVLVGVLGWVFGEYMGYGSSGLVLAAIISAVMAFGSYYYSDRIVLGMSRARPVDPKQNPYLYHTIEGLSLAAGIPVPKMYIIDDTAPNAFATGRSPQYAAIAVTSGLLEKLNREELEGVIGHEMSHIKNYDIRFATLAVVMLGTVTLLSDWLMRSFWWGGRRRRDRGERGSAGAIIALVALVLAILSPLIAQLMRLAISRQREYLADASGALLTRYPPGLASALEKIAADREPLEAANKATAHLFIVNPLVDIGGKVNSLFDTHPPTAERVRRLRGM